MISLETKTESASSSPIGFKAAEEEPTLSFSALLKGIKNSPKDDKNIQNGAFVISLEEEKEVKGGKSSSKTETLLSLLKHDDKAVKEELQALELNPKAVKNLSATELKNLIADAKNYLKDRIIDSDGYKRAQTKDLPKTLKGLAEIAKKFGVDVSKITVEEVKASVKPTAENIKSAPVIDTEEEAGKTKNTKEEKTISTQTSTATLDDDVEVKVKTPHAKNAKVADDKDIAQEVKVKEDIKENIKLDNKKVDTIKEVKATPLFKAQDKTEHTTEQLVQTKQFKVEEKTPKTKADETLKLLLRGEKPTANGTNTTADFSVATARVLASTATSEATKSLEKLLHGEASETASKTDGLTAHKADSFEVKLNEAKQMIKYLSQDVKTAIEDYKAPFTRVKVQLNPQKLGEVDLTVVQRGKNLHVNISSNNVAINALAMNANDLKAQLTNSGINNATLNFNNQDGNNSQSGQQQQNRQNERKADQEYNYFENEEQNEEVLSSLEIIVPNYA
ncbi:flagellar hook-length control protein FliK [Sulfurimonas sp.]